MSSRAHLLLIAASASLTVSLAAQGTKLGAIDPYLMPRAEEIAMARSSAPGQVGAQAAVWVLTRSG